MNKAKIIINLLGRKRSGKETFYKLLCPYIKDIAELQFATPLKKLCIEILGLEREQCYGSDACRETVTSYRWDEVAEIIKVNYPQVGEYLTARQVLQIVGTDLFRNLLSKDIWTRAAINTAIKSQAKVCVFTDGRFINEIDALDELKKSVNRVIHIRLYRETGLTDKHTSEIELDDLDLYPNQRSLICDKEAFLARGYVQLAANVWKTKDSKVNYLVDNNKDVESLAQAALAILKEENIICDKDPS